jgi:cytochrome c peroxidase
MFLLLLAAMFAIPLGLDLYMPVPEDNPITTERVERGRELFFDKRLSRDRTIAAPHATNRSVPSATGGRWRSASSTASAAGARRRW